MCPGIQSAFPDFSLGDILTVEGEQCLRKVHEESAGISSASMLVSRFEILKPEWKANPHFCKQQKLTSNGGKPIARPLFVIHGQDDPVLSASVVRKAVKATTDLFPAAEIQYVELPNVTHVPALAASQPLWMDFIAERFAGQEMKKIDQRTLTSARPASSQQSDQNWYLKPATEPYHAPGP